MILNHIILAMLWILYGLLHSALASRSVKEWFRRRMKDFKWYRVWYTLFAFVFFAFVIYYQVIIPTIQLFDRRTVVLIAGSILSVSGLIIMLICIRKYFLNLSGLRSLLVENVHNELQVSGIHNYVRHPLYLGTFAFIWGLFLLFPLLSLLITNAIITVYTVIGIQLEERKLIDEFGNDYIQYRNAVPKLIPFTKSKRKQ